MKKKGSAADLKYATSIQQNSINWEKEHLKKMLKELKQAGIELTLENISQIIEETSFRVRSQKHPDECPQYQLGELCFKGVVEFDFNCLLCSCPNYDVHFRHETIVGRCLMGSSKGKYHYSAKFQNVGVLDCTACPMYHSPKEVTQYLRANMDRLKEIASRSK